MRFAVMICFCVFLRVIPMNSKGKPSKDDLIRLVDRIQNESGCIVDLDSLITRFEQSVPNPEISAWIFDPPDGKRKSPEEIVNLAFDTTS